MKRCFFLLSFALFGALGACKAVDNTDNSTPAGDKVTLNTTMGDIVIQLDLENAPISSANFLKYVKSGHYDGVVFHRVVDGFMIQGGGFELKGGKLTRKSSGQGIQNESTNGLKNLEGTIAMARTQDPDSATDQFFINVNDNSNLDNPDGTGYAVFGKVIEGMDVVNKIKVVETGRGSLIVKSPFTGQVMEKPTPNVPVVPVVIKSATISK